MRERDLLEQRPDAAVVPPPPLSLRSRHGRDLIARPFVTLAGAAQGRRLEAGGPARCVRGGFVQGAICWTMFPEKTFEPPVISSTATGPVCATTLSRNTFPAEAGLVWIPFP